MSAKYKSPSFLLPNELNTSANTANDTGINSLYSMDFDGSSQYVNTPQIDLGSTNSISFWINNTASNSGTLFGDPNAYNTTYALSWSTTANILSFRLGNGDNGYWQLTVSSGLLRDGNWHHHCLTRDGVTINYYIDGVLQTNVTNNTLNASAGTNTTIKNIMARSNGTSFASGKLDEVAIFNRALNTTEIAALYGGTSPNIYPSNLMATDLNPIAYYPLGEQAQNTGYLDPSNPGSDMSGSEWQFPNGVLQDYVMDFDSASSDYIDTNYILDVTSDFSVSTWIKIDGNSNHNILGTREQTTGASVSKGFTLLLNSSKQIYARIFTTTSSITQVNAGVIQVGQWFNVVATYVASTKTLKIYRNGIEMGSVTGTSAGVISPDNLSIGRVGIGGVYGYFDGKISNVAIWNSDQSTNIDNIYNNGSPQTTYTVTPQNWWKLNTDSVYTPSAPNYTTALDFDGSSDYIDLNFQSQTTPATISMWVNTDVNDSQQRYAIINGRADQQPTVYLRMQNDNTYQVFISNTNGSDTLQGSSATINTWFHFAIVCENSQTLLYENGVLKDSSTIGWNGIDIDQSNNWQLGRDSRGQRYWKGKISNASICNTALTSTQISTLFNFGTPETNISFNPTHWWKLDDQTAITDYGSGGINGTNNGATDATTSVAVVPSWKIPSALTIPTVNYTAALDFDKTQNDNVFIGSPSAIQNLTNITLSVWVKVPYSYDSYYTVASKGEYGASGSQWYLTVKTGNSGPGGSFVIYKTSNSTSATSVNYTTNIDDNKWHNIVCINDGTDLKVYIDGQLDATNAGNGGNIYNGNRDLKIGRLTASSIGKFDGLMSNMVIWGDSQETEVPNIYNNGTPATSYTNTPVAWWKLDTGGSTITDYGSGGNNGTNNGAAKVESNVYVGNVPVNGVSTTLTSTALQQSDLQFDSPYSNYSLSFDGATYIDCTDNDMFSFGNDTTDSPFSVSFWTKLNSVSGTQPFLSKDTTSPNREWAISIFSDSSNGVRIFLKNQGGDSQQSIDSSTALTTGVWYHITTTYDGRGGSDAADGLSIYINGSLDTPTNIAKATYTAMSNTTAPVYIGKYSTSEINGKIDETAIFNTELTSAQVLEIYNNGRPKDLTTFSGTAPISWWRLGENAYFDNNSFVVPNSITGAPNGTGSGTITTMISADAPGTYANGIGTNLDILDRVGDAPLSTSNSQSYNMIPSDISPYVPGYVGLQTDNIYSMNFDSASADYISIGSLINLGTSSTISFWYKTSSNNQGLVPFGGASAPYYYVVQWGSSVNKVYFRVGTTVHEFTGVTEIEDGSWHHYCIVRTGADAELFVDGNSRDTLTGLPSATDTLIDTIGATSNGTSNLNNSYLDEVGFWNTALNADQVNFDLYQPSLPAGSNKTADIANNPNLPNPVAWYRMGD